MRTVRKGIQLKVTTPLSHKTTNYSAWRRFLLSLALAMSESPNKPELFFGEVNEAQGIDKIACKFEESCCGIRVFYFDGQRNCDHTEKHEDDWKDEPTDATDVNLGALEAGTIVAIPRFCGKRYGVIVVWDCGHDVYYREDELEKLRVFDLGPAGNDPS